jgi:(E)-4-hydroxy-3-methylbut-2-enyl-diphosphate synthase
MATSLPYPVPRSREITIGKLKMGGNNPVVIQSMANTDTLDLPSSLHQFKTIVNAGSQIVRFTTQGEREVEALGRLIRELPGEYTGVPVVADVHFRSDVALKAAAVCHKVRINPGNFAPPAEIRSRVISLLEVCKKHRTALRIGVNHGSLSKSIMNKFGDTPEGMVESALEFLRICRDENFHEIVVSLKSSNTVLMIHAVRQLRMQMISKDLCYPVHLGVTESGNAMEGRIKSVVGMAPLLAEGIGDTIRVSLTEPPENEIPVAQRITRIFTKPSTLPYHPFTGLPWDPFHHNTRSTREVLGIGGTNPPVVISAEGAAYDPEPDITALKENYRTVLTLNNVQFVPVAHSTPKDLAAEYLLANPAQKETRPSKKGDKEHAPGFLLTDAYSDPEKIAAIKEPVIIILDAGNTGMTHVKKWLISYIRTKGYNPVILRKHYSDRDQEEYMVRAAGEFALLLVDRLINGTWIENPHMSDHFNNKLSFNILQASRSRITATEYIACPSCGRTKFDIQSVLEEVKSKTNHLKGLKIAVMGCVVNGPGEMADADYGYIGSGNGKVHIYKGKDAILKNVPANRAVEKLIGVIKKCGDWQDP